MPYQPANYPLYSRVKASIAWAKENKYVHRWVGLAAVMVHYATQVLRVPGATGIMRRWWGLKVGGGSKEASRCPPNFSGTLAPHSPDTLPTIT